MAPIPELIVQWPSSGRPLKVQGPVYSMSRLPVGAKDKHGDVVTAYTPDWARVGYVRVGTATMRSPQQSGHEIEGRVTIRGKSYSAFTSGGTNPDGGEGMIIVRNYEPKATSAASLSKVVDLHRAGESLALGRIRRSRKGS